MAVELRFTNIWNQLRTYVPDIGLAHLAETRNKLQALKEDGTLKSLEAEIRAQIRWEEWKPGMRAPTGMLWEDIYPVLKADPNRKAYIVYFPGTVYFETEHYLTRQPLLTDAEVAASAEALINDKVREILEGRIAEEILARW